MRGCMFQKTWLLRFLWGARWGCRTQISTTQLQPLDYLDGLKRAQKDGLAGNRTLDHSHAFQLLVEMEMLREYYTTKPQAQIWSDWML
jgi:hypothetical protein